MNNDSMGAGGRLGLAVGLFVACTVAWAQAPRPPAFPPALESGAAQKRTLEQRQELEQQQPPKEEIRDPIEAEEPPPPAPAAQPAEGVRFELKGVRINDSAFLSREELTALARPYVGRTVGFAELQELVGKINAAYRARGIGTAQAVLPPQKIEAGIVRVELVEGRLGELKVSGNAYTKERFILDRIAMEQGAIVDTEALQRALIRFNRTSDIQLKAALQPGAGYGLTDVLLSVQEPDRNVLQFFLDNQGAESTGEYQLGLYARRNGLFGWDDQLAAYLVGSDGTLTGSLSYNVPVNRRNGRLALSYAQNDLEIVKGPFEALDITGTSSTLMLSYLQPVYVDERSRWDVSVSGSLSDSQTEISGVPFSESKVTKFSVGTSYDRAERWGRWMTTHTLSHASVDSDTEKWPSFFAYSGSVNVIWPVGNAMTVAANLGWYWLNKEQAPASELYQVGGLHSVRGYEQGILSAARGYNVQLEVHRQLWGEFTGYVFLDHGAVFPEPKESITGAGVGITWRSGKRWYVNVSYGAAFDKVVPDQESGRLDARVVLSFYP